MKPYSYLEARLNTQYGKGDDTKFPTQKHLLAPVCAVALEARPKRWQKSISRRYFAGNLIATNARLLTKI